MKRKILFRAKSVPDLKGSRWVYGGIHEWDNETFIIRDGISFAVDPKTVGQLIVEFKKSNGETFQIFEHDIIRFTWENFIYKKPLVALWDGEENGFVLYRCDKNDPLIRNDGRVCPVYPEASNLFRDMTEIVGNAIDNPELLWWSQEAREILL